MASAGSAAERDSASAQSMVRAPRTAVLAAARPTRPRTSRHRLRGPPAMTRSIRRYVAIIAALAQGTTSAFLAPPAPVHGRAAGCGGTRVEPRLHAGHRLQVWTHPAAQTRASLLMMAQPARPASRAPRAGHFPAPGLSRFLCRRRGLLASAEAGGAPADYARLEAFFGECLVREWVPGDEARLQSQAASADLVAACRETGGGVLVAVRGDQIVAVAGAIVQGATATLHAAVYNTVLGDENRELLPFLVRCMEAVCRQRHDLTDLCVATEISLQSPNTEPLLLRGYEQAPSGTLRKTLPANISQKTSTYNIVTLHIELTMALTLENLSQAGSGATCSVVEQGRAGEKGSKELLTVVDTHGRDIAVLPRAYVEKFNLLIPAIGVLVHNQHGQIYVHQRSATKSMHASYYDMMVGGLPLAGESILDAARNEVGEELGIWDEPLHRLFTVTWLGSRNRVILTIFRVCVGEGVKIVHDDGEVVWGKFISLSELEAMMQREKFVPGGLKAWQETVDRSLHTQYLK
jgi:isopentenyldiphosphate isomerase/transposase InsO family protein